MISVANSTGIPLTSEHIAFIPTTESTYWGSARATTRQKPNEQDIDKILFNSLAILSNSETLATVTYRWRGEDTLTVGNFAGWVEASYIRSSFKVNAKRPEDYHFLIDYSDLHEVVSVAKLPQIRIFYEFRNTIDVITFLIANSFLIDWLIDSHPTLVKCFGSKTKLILEVVRDPEGNNSEQLLVAVQSSCSVDEGMTKLDNLDRSWFFDQIHLIGEKVIVNLEFI